MTSNGVRLVNTVQRLQVSYSLNYNGVSYLGLKERQERERETVARAILDAARDLFVTHGYQEVSIRKIAEKIEYSPAAIYGYFPSKDDIFFALAEEGFRLLFEYAEVPATPSDADPADRIRRQFWRYLPEPELRIRQ